MNSEKRKGTQMNSEKRKVRATACWAIGRQCTGEEKGHQEFTGGEQITEVTLRSDLKKLKCIALKFLSLEEVIGDVSDLCSSPFTCKERHVYFDMSLILSRGRRSLLILISVYLFLPQECTPICGCVSLY
jgi:hypothetical protein